MTVAPTKPSFAAKFAWLRPTRNQPLARYLGVEIGVDAVRVVTLGARHRDKRGASERKQRSLRWLGSYQFPLPVNPLAAPPRDWVDRVIGTLREQLPRSVDGDQNIVAVCLPLPWVHYQVVPASEIEASRQQCDAMFASSLFQSKSHLGYWPLKEQGQTQPEDPMVIAAIAESAAFEVAEAICALGYQIESVVPHGVALAAAAEAMTGVDPQSSVVLNRSGGLIAVQNRRGCGLCRLLPPVPGPILAETTSQGLTIDAIRPWLNDVAEEVSATRRYVQRSQNARATQPILLCGDVAPLAGVDEALATLAGAPVARWRYAGQSRPSPAPSSQPAATSNHDFDDAEYAVALSLAYAAIRTEAVRAKK